MELIKDTKERRLGKHRHRCRICGAEGDFDSYLVKEMMNNTGDEFEYFVCPECTCLQIGEVPEKLGDYYGETYYSFDHKGSENEVYDSPVTDHTKVLDVGCGSGEWLHEQAMAGMDNLFGCDPFIDRDINYGERVYIKKCAITEIEGDGTFDVVRMWDSLEHMTDPENALVQAKRLVKAGGIIGLSVPTFPNIAFDMFETYWYQLDAPRHIFLPSLQTIKYLADKTGFEITGCEYDSKAGQILVSFFYQHGICARDITDELAARYFSQEEIRKLQELSEQANKDHRGDHMLVQLKKKED